jgi:hypothetical protein
MYTLTVKNNYVYDIGASNGVTIAKAGNHIFNKRGSIYFTVPGIGEINFIKKLKATLFLKKLGGF